MKIIHQGGYRRDELLLYRLTVYKNLVDCAKALIAAMQQFEIQPRLEGNKERCEYLINYQIESHPEAILEPKFGQAITSVWKDPCVANVLEHQTEFYLMDSAP